MQPLVLLAFAALQAALVGALQLPVGVVINALPSLGLPAPGTCAREAREGLSSPQTPVPACPESPATLRGTGCGGVCPTARVTATGTERGSTDA